MTTPDGYGDPPSAGEIEPELRARTEAAAARRGISVRDSVAALRAALTDNEEAPATTSDEWSRLSRGAFAGTGKRRPTPAMTSWRKGGVALATFSLVGVPGRRVAGGLPRRPSSNGGLSGSRPGFDRGLRDGDGFPRRVAGDKAI